MQSNHHKPSGFRKNFHSCLKLLLWWNATFRKTEYQRTHCIGDQKLLIFHVFCDRMMMRAFGLCFWMFAPPTRMKLTNRAGKKAPVDVPLRIYSPRFRPIRICLGSRTNATFIGSTLLGRCQRFHIRHTKYIVSFVLNSTGGGIHDAEMLRTNDTSNDWHTVNLKLQMKWLMASLLRKLCEKQIIEAPRKNYG